MSLAAATILLHGLHSLAVAAAEMSSIGALPDGSPGSPAAADTPLAVLSPPASPPGVDASGQYLVGAGVPPSSTHALFVQDGVEA